MNIKENYSNFGFYTAFQPNIISDAQGTEHGYELDMRGYNAITVIAHLASYASAGAQGAGDITTVLLYHGLASAAGVSAWSLVPGSQILHSVYGGIDSTGETGVIMSIMSKTELNTDSTAAQSGIIVMAGYKQDTKHRYLRVDVRNSDAASAAYFGAFAIMGSPGDWPINTPVENG
jgi:hypothetical protein